MIYRFGDFVLDEAAHTLSRNSREVPLEPKVLAFIILLVQQRGRVIARSVLHRSLWKGVVVGESSLNRVAKEARRALGDSGSGQNMIRTQRNVGYCFDAQVELEKNVMPSDESLRLIARAEQGLIASLEGSAADLRLQIQDFTSACRDAIERAQAGALMTTPMSSRRNITQSSSSD